MNAVHPLLVEDLGSLDEGAGLARMLLVIRRRWRTFLGTLLLVLAAVTTLAMLLPAIYKSTATVLIEQQEIPQDMVRPTITSYADQRLQSIQQRVMTRDNLLRIVNSYDLYPGKRDRLPTEAILELIVDSIDMQVVSGEFIDPRRGVPMEATIAFQLSFSDRSPDKAFKVANELYTLYHEENLQSRNAQVRETSSFLEAEARKLNSQVLKLEEELASFKEQHIDELPELLTTNWQLLDRADAEMREIDRSRVSLEDRILFLEAELAQLNPYEGIFSETGARILSSSDRLSALQTELAQAQARYSEDHPDLQRLRGDIAGLESEIGAREQQRLLRGELERARGELAAISERYSSEHPDVLLLSSQVELLAQKIEVSAGVNEEVSEATNPAYLQLRTRLESAQLELDSLDNKSLEVSRKQSDLETRIEQTPEVERKFRELAREYSNSASKYQEIKAKQLEAELAEALELERKGEKFTLIDPPRVPERPVSPNRPLIFALGLVLALGSAFAVMHLRENLDDRIYGASAVVDIIGLRPEVKIPLVRTVEVVTAHRVQRWWVYAVSAIALAVALYMVHVLVVPLDAGLAIMQKRFAQ